MQGSAVFHGQFRHLRLANGPDAQILHCLFEALGQQAVDYVLANLGRVAALHHRFRHPSGAETGNLCIFAVVANHAAVGLGNFFGGNVQHEFTGAIRI